jgi:hypothetical protein
MNQEKYIGYVELEIANTTLHPHYRTEPTNCRRSDHSYADHGIVPARPRRLRNSLRH